MYGSIFWMTSKIVQIFNAAYQITVNLIILQSIIFDLLKLYLKFKDVQYRLFNIFSFFTLQNFNENIYIKYLKMYIENNAKIASIV